MPPDSSYSTKPYLSLRHHFMDYVQSNGVNLGAPVILAEGFRKWLEFDTYSDLITFERHLAGVANVIPVILESEGSIAEFGAFSQELSIEEKLIVLCFGCRKSKRAFNSVLAVRVRHLSLTL